MRVWKYNACGYGTERGMCIDIETAMTIRLTSNFAETRMLKDFVRMMLSGLTERLL